MKKLLGIVFIFVAVMAMTQTILYQDTATFMWDAVTTDLNGDPLLPTDVVTYEVFLDDGSAANDQDIAQILYMGVTATTDYLLVFPTRTTWIAGVRAVVTPQGGSPVNSTRAWSDNLADVDPLLGSFTYVPVLSGPSAPENLRDSGM